MCNVRQNFSPALKFAENYQESSGTVIFVTHWKPGLNDLFWQKEVWKWNSWKKYVEMLTSSKLVIDWTDLTVQIGNKNVNWGAIMWRQKHYFCGLTTSYSRNHKKTPRMPLDGAFFSVNLQNQVVLAVPNSSLWELTHMLIRNRADYYKHKHVHSKARCNLF